MHVLSTNAAISAASIRYSLQCMRRASPMEAEVGSAVIGKRRGEGIGGNDSLDRIADSHDAGTDRMDSSSAD
jgi:hypothetical protein